MRYVGHEPFDRLRASLRTSNQEDYANLDVRDLCHPQVARLDAPLKEFPDTLLRGYRETRH